MSTYLERVISIHLCVRAAIRRQELRSRERHRATANCRLLLCRKLADVFRTVKAAEDAAETMNRVLKGHGFEFAQWGSSSREVLKSLPGTAATILDLDLDNLPVERTLGLVLDFNQDAFLIKTKTPDKGDTK